DVQERDRYGRLLAYVYLGDMMVNAEMVAQGYAQVMTIPPNVRHQDLFLKLQREARLLQIGLWRGTGPPPPERGPSHALCARMSETVAPPEITEEGETG
ncbi:MAG: thermonuclease family protein, partial [Gemmataceae bacterium]|nr:thermonuclease family protein [Gemmataceae bacterium]